MKFVRLILIETRIFAIDADEMVRHLSLIFDHWTQDQISFSFFFPPPPPSFFFFLFSLFSSLSFEINLPQQYYQQVSLFISRLCVCPYFSFIHLFILTRHEEERKRRFIGNGVMYDIETFI